MGNSAPSPDGNPVDAGGVQAIARTTKNIEIQELQTILDFLKNYSIQENTESIPYEKFNEALKLIENFEQSDIQIFDKLFTLFDVEGKDTVNYKDYIVGAICCLTTEKISDKIKISLSIYDTNGKDCCLKSSSKRFITAVNNTVSFFGDPVLTLAQLEAINVDLFKSCQTSGGYGIPIENCAEFFLLNELVQKFLNREGKVRYGSLELKAP